MIRAVLLKDVELDTFLHGKIEVFANEEIWVDEERGFARSGEHNFPIHIDEYSPIPVALRAI